MTKDTQLIVLMDHRTKVRLAEVASIEDRSMGWIVRKAVDEYLAQRKDLPSGDAKPEFRYRRPPGRRLMKFEDRWSNDEWAAKAKIYLDDKTAVKTEEVLFAIRSKDALPPGKYDIKAMESVLRAMGWQQFIRIDRQENQEILWFETDPRA